MGKVFEAAWVVQLGVVSFDTPRRNPEHPRRGDGIDGPPLPPGDFVAEAMDVAVMGPAWSRVADLALSRARVGYPSDHLLLSNELRGAR